MRLSIFICVLLYFASCSGRNAVPDGVLPPAKMQTVLWDVMRADEVVNYYANTDTAYKRVDSNLVRYQQVFKLHDITAQTFHRSMQYYQQRPHVLQPILDSLKSYSERKAVLPSSGK